MDGGVGDAEVSELTKAVQRLLCSGQGGEKWIGTRLSGSLDCKIPEKEHVAFLL